MASDDSSKANEESERGGMPKSQPESGGKSSHRLSLFSYLVGELSRGYAMEDDELYSEKQRRVSTFMKTPRELEKLMLFGFFICLDAFLFHYTFLPIRVAIATLQSSFRFLTCSRGRLLQAAQKCDIIRASILVLCSVAMSHVDTSVLYHVVRGQSVIKLYVIYNMLEILDRLLGSIGQDTLDTLYWMSAERRGWGHLHTLFYFLCANIYVMVHSMVILVQAVTLNVALNSHSKALITILVSNNFVELKGSVFKKFETNNLFQMSCSVPVVAPPSIVRGDTGTGVAVNLINLWPPSSLAFPIENIRERFHYVVLLTVVCARNLAQFNWDLAYLVDEFILWVITIVFVSEILVDWIKHAFITKFNNISPNVYRSYRAILARDLVTSRHKNAKADHSDLVARRMGFIPLPLGCLLWRTFSQSLSFPWPTGPLLLAVLFLCLTALKVLIGIVLLGQACKYRHSDSPAQNEGQSSNPIGRPSPSDHVTQPTEEESSLVHRKSDSRESETLQTKPKAKSLQDIDRYTLCSNRIV